MDGVNFQQVINSYNAMMAIFGQPGNSMQNFQMPIFSFDSFGFNFPMSFDNNTNLKPVKIPNAQMEKIIDKVAKKYGMTQYKSLIAAVIEKESGFNANAHSKAGAMGLMQLMPGTAKSLGVVNPYDPEQNVEGGVKFLARLLKKYNGNVKLALAAYNAGEGNVSKYGGVPPFRETQNYVASISQKLGVGGLNYNS